MNQTEQQDETIQSLNQTIESLTIQLNKKQSSLEEESAQDFKHQEKVLISIVFAHMVDFMQMNMFA